MKTTYICHACNAEFDKPTPTYDSPMAGVDGYRVYDGCPECGSAGFEKKRSVIPCKTELRQYLYLKKEYERDVEKLVRLTEAGNECDDLYELVENNRLRVMAALIRIQSFVYSIDDSLLRQIFEYRYIEGKKWAAVAASLGGYLTEDHVRILHDRYLKALQSRQ